MEFHTASVVSTFGRFSTCYGEPYSPILSIVSQLANPLPTIN
ncbi:hypothetical protein EMIT0194P_260005 [Pseudomonas serbica]